MFYDGETTRRAYRIECGRRAVFARAAMWQGPQMLPSVDFCGLASSTADGLGPKGALLAGGASGTAHDSNITRLGARARMYQRAAEIGARPGPADFRPDLPADWRRVGRRSATPSVRSGGRSLLDEALSEANLERNCATTDTRDTILRCLAAGRASAKSSGTRHAP